MNVKVFQLPIAAIRTVPYSYEVNDVRAIQIHFPPTDGIVVVGMVDIPFARLPTNIDIERVTRAPEGIAIKGTG
jgi:hypothetical protein